MSSVKVVILGVVSLFCCTPADRSQSQPAAVRHNFIVLLDLSDRLQDRNQVDRDIRIITSIFGTFKSVVQKNMYIRSTDQFNILVAPQKNEDQRNIIQIENQLQLNLKSLTTGQKKKQFDVFEHSLPSNLKNLYNFAVRGKSEPSDYFGADIWKFFNDDLQNLLVPGSINHLFIVTDGYIYFEDYGKTKHSKNRYSSCQFMNELRENDWEEKFEQNDYGIIPTTKTYANLEVMVLEVDPQSEFPNEYNLLIKIWTKWLWEMKIKKIHISKISPLDKVNEDISEFTGLSRFKVGATSVPLDAPLPIEGPKLQGRFIGSIAGYSRELEIENVYSDDDDNLNFVYSIKGLGAEEKHRNGKLSKSDNSIEFETIGLGYYEIKNGRYVFMSSKVAEWTFSQI